VTDHRSAATVSVHLAQDNDAIVNDHERRADESFRSHRLSLFDAQPPATAHQSLDALGV
jgi:hypothetical protein